MNNENRYSVRYLEHYGIAQRWLSVFLNKARQRASETLNKAVKKERDKIESQLWHLLNKSFDGPLDAQQAVIDLVKKCRYHISASEPSVLKKHHRLRQVLATQNETLPNQINQPTKAPTMRLIFQLMDGMHYGP